MNLESMRTRTKMHKALPKSKVLINLIGMNTRGGGLIGGEAGSPAAAPMGAAAKAATPPVMTIVLCSKFICPGA